MYISTGDKDAIRYSGCVGILKSTDGGKTWSTTGLQGTQEYNTLMVHEILIHPDNSNIIYVATNRGLLKSTNAAASFNELTEGNIYDLELMPGNPETIYIVKDKDVYVSTNSGSSFSKKWGPTTADRCMIAVTKAAPNNVYISAKEGVYVSTDKGLNFEKMSDSPTEMPSYWFKWAINVSPQNENEIYVGSTFIYKSLDGGKTWSNITGSETRNPNKYVHLDFHDLEFSGNILYAGTDGGIYKTPDGGSTWNNLSKGMGIKEFYRLGTSKSNPDLIVAGAQDNGTSIYKNGTWYEWLGSDGMEALVHPTNENILYGSQQYGDWHKTTDGGKTRNSHDAPEFGPWVTPAVMHPSNPDIIYAGYEAVWKTTDGMKTWKRLPDLGAKGLVEALAISESNPDVLYASVYEKIFRTTDGGNSWEEITNGLQVSDISYITIDPKNAQKVAISVTGEYRGKKVYLSSNGGDTWENISQNLPNFPARCVVFDYTGNDGLYVGMEVGVYYRNKNMSEWDSYFDNLPNSPIGELEISLKAGKIRAATYGRGLWEAPLYGEAGGDAPSSIVDHASSTAIKLVPNSTNDLLRIDITSELAYTRSKIGLYDMSGKLVKSAISDVRNPRIDISGLEAGVYIVKVQLGQDNISQKFLKK